METTMKMFIRALFLSTLVAAGACSKSGGDGKDKTSATKEEVAKQEGSGHAPKDVVPGSHEDWCEEHQVPESQDTRCDPSLIPAFKATGDWCEEHGVPESQCLKCNPDLKIVRPPKK
jgi:hypothetical protein